MHGLQTLIPARFLILMSHLVFVITLFWSVNESVRACLPVDSQANFDSFRTELIVAFSLTLFLFVIELIGFSVGFSMFSTAQTLLSIVAHAGATVALSFYAFDSLYCRLYWYIFGFCSVLPTLTEIGMMVSVLWLKKSV